MKSRLTLIFAALVILLAAMVFVVQERPSNAPVSAMATVPVVPAPTVAIPVLPAVSEAPVPAPAPAVIPPVARPSSEKQTAPMVSVDTSGDLNYVARDGDTVSQLAIALLGSDSKEHRDAVIAANTSLQTNPDRVLMGETYSIAASSVPSSDEATDRLPSAAAAIPVVAAGHPVNEKAVVAATGPKLKYTAQPGDSVAVLAGNLLGGDTKANRDSIIAGNASLKQNPDHLEAGKSYTITAPNGLAADPAAPQPKAPTTQPDADELARLSVGRTLRYTALPGDTVSRLAVALLGSDTPANRDLIVRSNPSLKQDPDHLVAGQTYWIAAPTPGPLP
jgi:hypothetical protein